MEIMFLNNYRTTLEPGASTVCASRDPVVSDEFRRDIVHLRTFDMIQASIHRTFFRGFFTKRDLYICKGSVERVGRSRRTGQIP